MVISKKAEGGVFGMSFGMIFSIILIVFFVIIAGIAINFFLKWQKCSQLGLLVEDIKKDVNNAFFSESSSFSRTYNAPTNLEYLCFANLTTNVNQATLKEETIFNALKKMAHTPQDNLYFYSTKSLCLTKSKIERIELGNKNPICFQIVNGKITIKYERTYSSPLVKIS